MSATNRTPPLSLRLPDELVDQLAERVISILDAREHEQSTPATEPWLDAKGAAQHLACTTARIYNHTSRGTIPHHHDGSRVLFRASELDAWVQQGGNRRGA